MKNITIDLTFFSIILLILGLSYLHWDMEKTCLQLKGDYTLIQELWWGNEYKCEIK